MIISCNKFAATEQKRPVDRTYLREKWNETALKVLTDKNSHDQAEPTNFKVLNQLFL